ncbi:helix-turn-helix transcriptional regulator [Niallia taxi]|uniref:helix-turn-helix transcriptional regulator n=1 Tax=Niallia taxi TaxID=2499688 RepID=UPI003F623920
MTINMKIKSLRNQKNIKQAIIANALGITVQAYSMKEMGKRPITTNEVLIISRVLEVPVGNFFE